MARELTIKQQNFIDEYIRNEGNATAAYRHAYNADKMKDETIMVKASELMKNGKVSVRLKEQRNKLNNAVQEEFVKSRHDLLREMEALKHTMLPKITSEDVIIGDPRIALDCMKEQGKLLGYYEEILKHIGDKDKPVKIEFGWVD